MDYSSKPVWLNEKPTSSAILLDHSSVEVQRQPAKIRHYFVLSLVSALCLCPYTGLIALAYSIKSSAKADVNFHEKARLYSRRALRWNIASIVLSFVFAALIIYYFYFINQVVRSFHYRTENQLLSARLDALRNSVNSR